MRTHYQTAPRRWRHGQQRAAILLWLLPYLVLSLFNGGAHNHDFFVLPGFSSVASLAASEIGDGLVGPSEAQLSSLHFRFDAGGECLACLWASSALGILAAPLLFGALRWFGSFRLRAVLAIGIDARGHCPIRGPPLSWKLVFSL